MPPYRAIHGSPALMGQGVDPLGLTLCRVVLPQLDVGVRPVGELGELTQRRAVREGGQHGAGGEVRGDPDDLVGAKRHSPQRALGTAVRSTST